MNAAFDDWLAWLRSAKHGPVTLYATRGRNFAACIRLDDDFTGSTLRGQVRMLADDGAVTVLGTFTVGAAVVEGGETLFAVSLPGAAIAAMPQPVPGGGSAAFAYDLLITQPMTAEELLIGGAFSVGGRVTR